MDQSGWVFCCSSANALSQVDSAWKGVYEPSDARLGRVGGTNTIGDLTMSDGAESCVVGVRLQLFIQYRVTY